MVPILTTEAGTCLTAKNWQEAGTDVASFHVASLLMKPGYDFLRTLPNLATYVGWPKKLVLNASLPKCNADGFFPLRSKYDGCRMEFSTPDILDLIISLKPDIVILPEGIGPQSELLWQLLPETITPFLPVTDVLQNPKVNRSHGIYFSYDEKTSSVEVLFEALAAHQDRPCYVGGDLSLPLMQDLIYKGVRSFESDLPAKDAYCGNVYCNEGVLSLQDNAFSNQFVTIDKSCHCPTCNQQLTRAYLHHLFVHTPLLCQRFLIQHNVHYSLNMLRQPPQPHQID